MEREDEKRRLGRIGATRPEITPSQQTTPESGTEERTSLGRIGQGRASGITAPAPAPFREDYEPSKALTQPGTGKAMGAFLSVGHGFATGVSMGLRGLLRVVGREKEPAVPFLELSAKRIAESRGETYEPKTDTLYNKFENFVSKAAKQGESALKDFEDWSYKTLQERIGEHAEGYVSQASAALGQGVGQIGAAVINPYLGFTFITGQSISSGGDAYDRAYEAQMNKGLPEEEARRTANINGWISGTAEAIEMVPIMRILPKPVREPIKRGIGATTGRILKTAGIESATEGAQELIQSGTAALTYDDEATLGSTVQDAIWATLISIPTGVMFGGIGEGNLRQQQLRQNYIEKASGEISEILVEQGIDQESADQYATTLATQYVTYGDQDLFLEAERERARQVAEEAMRGDADPELDNISFQRAGEPIWRRVQIDAELAPGKVAIQDTNGFQKIVDESELGNYIPGELVSRETFTGEQIASELRELGTDGDVSDFLLNQVRQENYQPETISIQNLRQSDPDLNSYLESGEIREFSGESFAMDPIVTSQGEVLDGYNRIAQALANGETELSVLRGVPQETSVSQETTPQRQALIEEARRFDSVEDFIDNSGELVHHGSNQRFSSANEINIDDIFYTLRRTEGDLRDLQDVPADNFWSRDDLIRMPAKAFGTEINDFVARFENPRVVDFEGRGWFEAGEDQTYKLAKEAREQGHDGLIIRNVHEGSSAGGTLGTSAGLVDNYIPLKRDTLFTREDLESIYNEAQSDETPRFQRTEGELLAPNGQPSNLSPEQHALVRTKAFKDWFGDWENDPENASKVVDENGEPLVVYHGSPADFTVFSTERMGTQGTSEGHGFYFTPSREVAEGYAERRDGGEGRLFEVFLDIKNPYSNQEKTFTRSQTRQILEALNELDPDLISNYGDVGTRGLNAVLNEATDLIYDSSDRDTDIVGDLVNASGGRDEVLTTVRRVTGGDGVFDVWNSVDEDPVQVYVVPTPSQIKLADGSNRTFDPGNDDIRFQRAAEGVSSKLIEDLSGREFVKKSYVEQRIVSGDLNLKQVEKDLARQVLERFGDSFSVAEFSQAMAAELLPLNVKVFDNLASEGSAGTPRYDSVSLQDSLRGEVENYAEHIYESPVRTFASNIHFEGDTENYFGHTRIEDMSDGTTRRVIEAQSDLYQKGQMEQERNIQNRDERDLVVGEDLRKKIENRRLQIQVRSFSENPDRIKEREALEAELRELLKERDEKLRQFDTRRLQQYNNPTAHFRMVREEVKRAAQDEKSVLLFPTGETAMKIEGLGDAKRWYTADSNQRPITADALQVGGEITTQGGGNHFETRDVWVVTEVLENGRFKAVPKNIVDAQKEAKIVKDVRGNGQPVYIVREGAGGRTSFDTLKEAEARLAEVLDNNRYSETFDISGTIDTNNPIYRFYEKDLAKYLRQQYQATPFTDEQGVTWNRVEIKPEYADQPVLAFQRDGTATTPAARAADFILDFQRRAGVDFPIFIYKQIFTGEMRPDGLPMTAYGMYTGNAISLSERVAEFTGQHEVTHFAFDNLESIPLFEGITRENILNELRKEYGENRSDSYLEERLAEKAEAYARDIRDGKTPKPKGAVGRFIERLYELIRDFLGMSPREASEVNKFFNALYFNTANRGNIITFQDTGRTSEFMRERYAEFGEDAPSFQRVDGEYTPPRASQNEVREAYAYEVDTDRILVEGEPILNLYPLRETFDETVQNSIDAFENSLSHVITELELYQAGGQMIPLDGGFVRQQAQGLRELPASERQTAVVREVYEAMSKGEAPTSKRGRALYDHQISKAFAQLTPSQQMDIGFALDRIVKAKQRTLKDIQKDIAAAERISRSMTPRETRTVVNRLTKKTAGLAKLKAEIKKRNTKTPARAFADGKRAGQIIERERHSIKDRKAELKQGQKDIRTRVYAETVLDLLRKNLPRAEWGRYTNRLARVGNSEARYVALVKEIGERKVTLDVAEGMRRERASVRQKIGFLRKIYDIEPRLIRSIKQDLNIRDTYKRGERAGQLKDELKPIKDYTMEELIRFEEELQRRIEFREKNPPRYFENVELNEMDRSMKNFTESVTGAAETLFAPVERTLNNISPAIRQRLSTYFFDETRAIQKDLITIRPFVEAYSKANDDIRIEVQKSAQSGKVELLERQLGAMMPQADAKQTISEIRATLDGIHARLREVGVEVNYRENYFPRMTKPLTEDKAALLLRDFEYKEGRKATPAEREVIISNLMRGFNFVETPFITLSGKRFEARRITEEVTDSNIGYFHDAATSLVMYINAANRVIEQRRLFGKYVIEAENYDTMMQNSIGNMVYSYYEQGLIQQKDVQKLKDTLHGLFAERMNKQQVAIQNFTSNYVYPLALGQLASTINQVKDLSMQVLLNDIFHGRLFTFRGMNIKPEDVYLSETIFELEGVLKTKDPNKIARFLQSTMTPFGAVDNFFLNTFINSAYRRMIYQAKRNDQRFASYLNEVFGDDGAEVMTMLQERTGKEKGSELPIQIRRLIWGEVEKIRPITKLQKTRQASRTPAFYVLKNFAIKQLEFVRSNSFDIMVEGYQKNDKKMVAEGVAKLVVMLTVISAFGGAVDEFKDWILGTRHKESFKDRMVDNLLSIVGFNNYMLNLGKQQGYAQQTVYSHMLPAAASIPAQIIDYVIRDIRDIANGDAYKVRTYRRFPLIGDIIYRRFGGGSR